MGRATRRGVSDLCVSTAALLLPTTLPRGPGGSKEAGGLSQRGRRAEALDRSKGRGSGGGRAPVATLRRL